ncbi:MAG: DUF1837 domain-containing protein [Undibacterium sp.]|uniref:HamA C-terminal domain-containing protein n=1 Tax=Undibacterium sp. TaxID=1914977 RepID=UPI002723DBC1|nr:DUF1837 domain-containing protein [Undibacterium sp.]MDO8653308.1 DUF1837 domain-containing protein [Undibacterium sp.]
MSNLNALNDFLAVKIDDYHECIDMLEHDFKLDDVIGNIRFHHLKRDGNGRPMVKALAEMLYQYIIDYCIASKNRPEPLTSRQAAQLTRDARRLFRHPTISTGKPDQTGEAGEALLFFLTEAVLRAPQLVAKMELKTNNRDEVKGSDGIHIKWNEADNLAEFYFGEAKLYQDVNAAITSALKSIDDFHNSEMYKHEFSIITKHFKYQNEVVKNEIVNMIKLGEPGPNASINHTCLIGYDWERYKSIAPVELNKKFQQYLLDDSKNIVEKLNQKFSTFNRKYLKFEIFFLPFPSVSEFRNEFNAALD